MTFSPNDWVPAPNELAGKTILITGAARGIGRAVALACADHGAEVLIQGRDETALEELYDEIISESTAQPGIIPLDLAHQDASAYEVLSEELQAAGVRLDGLIYNASILGERKALAQTSVQSWHEVMQININAIFLLTRALMPLLEAASNASVVLTSSGVGRRGKAYWGA